jgi:hypothetical protein
VIYFAVTLAGMPVADFEQRSLGMHWNIQGRPSYEFLVVHVARVHPGWAAIQTASRERSHDHAAFLDRHGAGQDVSPGALVGDFFVNLR